MAYSVPGDGGRNRYQLGSSLGGLFLFEEYSGQNQIGGACDLDIAFRTSHDRYGSAQTLDETGFIGSVILVLLRAFKCLAKDFNPKGLWSLCEYEMFAHKCGIDHIAFHLLDGVDNRHCQYRCTTLVRLLNDCLDFLDSHKRPHGIVDRDDGNIRGQMLQCGGHRVLTAIAALNHRNGFGKTGRIHQRADFINRLARRGNDHIVDKTARIEFPDGVNEDGSLLKNKQLFRLVGLHPSTGASGGNYCGDFHTAMRSAALLRYFRMRWPIWTVSLRTFFPGRVMAGFGSLFFFVFSEDHFSGGGLQDARD